MDAKNDTELTTRKARVLKIIIGAAAAAVAMICLLNYGFDSGAAEGKPSTGLFVTRLGEHRCEKLPDASQVCLNTNTSVRYTFNQRTRNVELISGEASFAVQNGDHRPFDVLSGDLLVHDLSTSFNIYKKDHSTIVTVISGHVKVAAPVSAALVKEFKDGAVETVWKRAPDFYQLQQAEFDEITGTLYSRRTLAQEDLYGLTAWQQGRIDLNGKTLRDALVEFSRYHPIEKVSIPDRTLRDLHVGGEFLVANFMDFLDSLEYTQQIHHDIKKGADGRMIVTVTRERVATAHSSGK
jgi:transmembrane sensor